MQPPAHSISSRRGILSMGVMAILAASALLLFSAARASADETGCPGGNPTERPVSNVVSVGESPILSEGGNKAEYTFTSEDRGGVAGEGVPGLIEYCVYYPEGADPAVTVNAVAGGAQGFDGTFFEDPPKFEAFGFQRAGGNPSNIPFDGSTRVMGWGTWSGGAPTNQIIVLHINDEAECTNVIGTVTETCFVQPGETASPAADLEATKSAEPSFERSYEWNIEKNVDKTKLEIAEGGEATFNYTVTVEHNEGTDGGWRVAGTITVSNPNEGEVTGVNVEDNLEDGSASCEVEGGSNASIAGESVAEFPYVCEYGAAPEATVQTNKAKVSWPEQDVEGHPLEAGSVEPEAEVNWEEAAVESVDDEIEVEDTLGGYLGNVSVGGENPTVFEYPYTFTGDPPGECTGHDNLATFKTNDTGTEGEAEQEVEVCVGTDLKVSKTAGGAFKRKFPWSIEKTVDKNKITTEASNATFNYTIKVTKGTGEDSGWVVKGTITVENPNDFESIPVDVSDQIDPNAECTVEGGGEVTVPAGGSEELEYECTYSEPPAESEQTNTATATWDAEAASTPSGEATGTAGVDWSKVAPEETDSCLKEVTDTVDGTGSVLFPTAPGETLCASKEFKVEVTFKVEAGCHKHINTAAFVTKDTEATGEDSVEVEVCGSVLKSGALTMGFWHNKNGQKIITGDKETNKVCNATTWLRQFNPFKDLGEKATCKDVGAYFLKIFEAAEAGGSTMNPMLKAQMLATALNVYFSDPALGGNKIEAKKPIGGLKIDISKWSGAFGGAKAMTVMEMLTYAAGKSDSGGKTWYGQVKATQELAKNAFDAINNQQVYGAP